MHHLITIFRASLLLLIALTFVGCGSYAIQGLAAMFVTRLEGSYSGVMGLPLYETAELLRQFDITIL